ncbi:MAG: GHKL domain-containing protein [Lachnospiraceae bacterium]|nr:GHKL domain-containing protein [Lachnospiraceae bacterium]
MLVLLISMIGFISINTFVRYGVQEHMIEEKQKVLYDEAEILSTNYMNNYYMNRLTLTGLSTQLHSIDTFLNTRILIVKKNGEIFLDTRDPRTMSHRINIIETEPEVLSHTFSQPQALKDITNEPTLSVSLAVYADYDLKGYIVMLYATSGMVDELSYHINSLNFIMLAFTVLLFLLIGVIYLLNIRPLRKLTLAAKKYAEGDLDYTISPKDKTVFLPGEYEKLLESVQFMATEIKNLDDYQKKFVANISHDFRSPLTSIRGYAEAMKDGTIPYEAQEKYLDIILFETERLTKLTTNLLELNRFENNGVMLDISSFDINSVIKKTCETFEVNCLKKDIQLNLTFPEESTLVYADMGKIQQVLYNLIDNAIKFSHNNSKIDISTEIQNGKVFVSVKDYGIGIPKNSLKKVWERFYKTDTSRGKDKKGTGLGLSITKEIINAHKENINLISTEGVGTEFIFTLSQTKPQ